MLLLEVLSCVPIRKGRRSSCRLVVWDWFWVIDVHIISVLIFRRSMQHYQNTSSQRFVQYIFKLLSLSLKLFICSYIQRVGLSIYLQGLNLLLNGACRCISQLPNAHNRRSTAANRERMTWPWETKLLKIKVLNGIVIRIIKRYIQRKDVYINVVEYV